jgi:hypothetical protein
LITHFCECLISVNKKKKYNTGGTSRAIKQANNAGVRQTNVVFKRKLCVSYLTN